MNDFRHLQDDFRHLQATRYTSAAALVIILYDHLLTIPQEIDVIWTSRWNALKVLCLLSRYLVPTAVLMQTYDIVLHRLWALWEKDKVLVRLTFMIFVISQVVTLVALAVNSVDLRKSVIFNHELHACIMTKTIPLALFWGPGLAFELMVFLTALLNAIARPRTASTRLSATLYRDGFLYFVVLTAMRTANLIISVVSPLSLVLLQVFLVWSLNNITFFRLLFNTHASSDAEDDGLSISSDFERDTPRSIVVPSRTGSRSSKLSPAKDPRTGWPGEYEMELTVTKHSSRELS
ncbi:hypothetical protein PUNSTDRAFT_131618 [Punctularia strigosozonata HHB-11173 SS5]|uniref:uncharacterized protein n=1 Tax=Punctularia strigosozonata (strain HHB-11173) TaxID=741275 RepID=UPI0004417D46|nr:uncharacterized protein PUNSTDRAFT_131618 [Punctularia strigosozonata HHB-11173 SS5]EIN11453.1 hypothetical protein PUNSTDRAFT_131618 [Punctularia strigosozonata HHB-11173 SS5]